MQPSRMKINMIPWDPDSPEHIERLIAQRVQCGWSADKVQHPWVQWQREGMRSLFWLVSFFSPLLLFKLYHKMVVSHSELGVGH
jgi:hypothetical protein